MLRSRQVQIRRHLPSIPQDDEVSEHSFGGTVIEAILPNGVMAAELFEDPSGLSPHPMEAPLIARASDKRRREFTSARHCARLTMGTLGLDPAPIMRGPSGAPA